MTGTEEISMDAAIAAAVSLLDGIFAIKEEQKMALKAFLYSSQALVRV